MASAPHDPFVSITVKIDAYKAGRDKYPPLLSPYLVDGCRVGHDRNRNGFFGKQLDSGHPDSSCSSPEFPYRESRLGKR